MLLYSFFTIDDFVLFKLMTSLKMADDISISRSILLVNDRCGMICIKSIVPSHSWSLFQQPVSPLVLKKEYSELARSVPWLFMPWTLVSPFRQQECCSVIRINRLFLPRVYWITFFLCFYIKFNLTVLNDSSPVHCGSHNRQRVPI